MGFKESVRTCYSKYATFSGRAAKPEFWWFALLGIVIHLALGWVQVMAMRTGSLYGLLAFFLPILVSIAAIVLVYIPWMAAGSRRFHDIGWPGWVVVIPFALALPVFIPSLMVWGMVGDAGPPSNPLLYFLANVYFAIAMAGNWLMPLVVAVFAYLLYRPSQLGPNKYGPPPPEAAA